jgi:hypothetical protein
LDKFHIRIAAPPANRRLILFIKPFKDLHKAEQVLLCDLIVVLEAIVALEYELSLLGLVSVHKFLNVNDELCVLNVGRIPEVKEDRVAEQSTNGKTKLLFVACFHVVLEHLLVETVFPLADVLRKVALDFFHLLLRELDFLSLLAMRLTGRGLNLLHTLIDWVHLSDFLLIFNHNFNCFIILFSFPICTRNTNGIKFVQF